MFATSLPDRLPTITDILTVITFTLGALILLIAVTILPLCVLSSSYLDKISFLFLPKYFPGTTQIN